MLCETDGSAYKQPQAFTWGACVFADLASISVRFLAIGILPAISTSDVPCVTAWRLPYEVALPRIGAQGCWTGLHSFRLAQSDRIIPPYASGERRQSQMVPAIYSALCLPNGSLVIGSVALSLVIRSLPTRLRIDPHLDGEPARPNPRPMHDKRLPACQGALAAHFSRSMIGEQPDVLPRHIPPPGLRRLGLYAGISSI